MKIAKIRSNCFFFMPPAVLASKLPQPIIIIYISMPIHKIGLLLAIFLSYLSFW